MNGYLDIISLVKVYIHCRPLEFFLFWFLFYVHFCWRFPRKSVNKKRRKTNLLCHHHHINHSSWPISTWEIAQLVPGYLFFENARKNILKSNLVLVVFLVLESKARGGSRIFFRGWGGGGAVVSCSTSTPIIHFFFLQNTSCIRKPQVISGEGGGGLCTPCTLPLDPLQKALY